MEEKQAKIANPVPLTFLQKKNAVRKTLAEMGFIKKDKFNDYDKYTYLSEAGYKDLCTQLFSQHGLELKVDVSKIENFEGTQKMPFGRKVELEFTIQDIDSEKVEITHWTGEGVDKADKALYKAYTGAFKYFFANNFTVPTGDDAEADVTEPGAKLPDKPKPIAEWQAKVIRSVYKDEELEKRLLSKVKPEASKIEDLTYDEASQIIEKLKEKSSAQQEDNTQQ